MGTKEGEIHTCRCRLVFYDAIESTGTNTDACASSYSSGNEILVEGNVGGGEKSDSNVVCKSNVQQVGPHRVDCRRWWRGSELVVGW